MESIHKGIRFINQLMGRDVSYPIQVHCKTERLGTAYGGFYFCPESINKDSIIYSLGIGEDISFDLGIIDNFGASVFAFDPTPRSADWVKSYSLPDKFHFFEYGIANYDGVAKFFPPKNPQHVSYSMLQRKTTSDTVLKVKVHRLKSVMSMLNHDYIDLLKMNIEGAEYAVIDDLCSTDIKVHQLLVGFHHKFKNVDISKTKRAIELLNQKGLKIFHITSDGGTYSFINTHRLQSTH